MAIKFEHPTELIEWLGKRPASVSVVLGARTALRAVPAISVVAETEQTGSHFFVDLVSAIFRANAAAWSAAKYPSRTDRRSTSAAADAANRAAAATAASAAAASAALSNRVDAAIYAARAATYAARAAADDASAARATSYTAHAAANAHSNAAIYADANAFRADDVWEALSIDASQVELGANLAIIAEQRCWPHGTPGENIQEWQTIKAALDEIGGWQPWIDWYERRLTGETLSESQELVFVQVPQEKWAEGSVAANAWIAKELKELQLGTPATHIPVQGPGPHVEIDPVTNLIVRALPDSLDSEGNNVALIRGLLPQMQRLAAEALAQVGHNQHKELHGALQRYVDLLTLDPLDFSALWFEGVTLQERLDAEVGDGDPGFREPLSKDAIGGVNALLRTHGPFILASRAGQDLLASANAYDLTREQQAQARQAEEELVDALAASPSVVSTEVAADFAETVKQPDSRKHPERSGDYKAGFGQNIITVLGYGATIYWCGSLAASSLGLPMGFAVSLTLAEALKKSEPFIEVQDAFKSIINKTGKVNFEDLPSQMKAEAFAGFRKFFLDNEDLLLRIAGTRPQMRWLYEHIQWLKGTQPKH